MIASEIGTKLVALCNAQKDLEAVETLYDEKIVSIEAQGSDAMPARVEGIDAIRRKHAWWTENNEVHASRASGPFCGHRDDQFAVIFEMDLTSKASARRIQMSEVALYTVAGDKVVQEEFLSRVS